MPLREIKIRLTLSRDECASYLEDLFDLEFVGEETHDGLTSDQVQKFVANKVADAMGSFE